MKIVQSLCHIGECSITWHLNFSVRRLTELSAEPEEFGCEDVKPKAFDLPPDLETNVVGAISCLENNWMAKKE